MYPKSKYTNYRDFKCKCGKKCKKCDICKKRICSKCRDSDSCLVYCFVCYRRYCYNFIDRKKLCFPIFDNILCDGCRYSCD